MSAIPPSRIERGQTLGIVAPAGPVNGERLHAGLARLGDAFRLTIADSVTAPRGQGVPSYLAAADELRAAEFNAMLRDPDVRGILLARGGYGIQRILPRLDVDGAARRSEADRRVLRCHRAARVGVGRRRARHPWPDGRGDGVVARQRHRGADRDADRGARAGGAAVAARGSRARQLSRAARTWKPHDVLADDGHAVAAAAPRRDRADRRGRRASVRVDRYLTHLSLTGALAEHPRGGRRRLHAMCRSSAAERRQRSR